MAPLPRLGKFILAFGIIGLIRLIPEMLQISRYSRGYAEIATMDAVLALATCAAGEGVWHRKPWAPKLALRTAAVVLGTSILSLYFIVRFIIEHHWMDLFGIVRLLYYGLAVSFWPYGVRALIVSAPPGSGKSRTVSFFLWLVFGTPMVLILVRLLGAILVRLFR